MILAVKKECLTIKLNINVIVKGAVYDVNIIYIIFYRILRLIYRRIKFYAL